MMQKIVAALGRQKLLRWLFHEEHFILIRDLAKCETVLDLGCGHDSPLANCKNIKFSLGVDAFKPSYLANQKKHIHTQCLNVRVEHLKLHRHFDAVILIGLLEHLTKKNGLRLLQKSEKWAKQKIIISLPNGYYPQKPVGHNVFQKHRSGWTVAELESLGYKVHGITGAKFMYKQSAQRSISKNYKYSMENLRFSPKLLAFIVNCMLQLIVYFLPKYAHTLYAVKNVK